MAGGDPAPVAPRVVLVVIDKVPEIDAGRSESSCGRLKRDYKGLWGAYSIPSCSNPATANDHQLNRTVELVYNAADIDNANIVWARDMGDKNPELIRYFRDRQVWLVNGSSSPPQLMPYPADSLPAQGDRDTSSSTSHEPMQFSARQSVSGMTREAFRDGLAAKHHRLCAEGKARKTRLEKTKRKPA